MNELTIHHDFDLRANTTLGFSQKAAHYVEVNSELQLANAVRLAHEQSWPILPLGSGSNVVLVNDYPGLVIKQVNQDIRYQPLSGGIKTHVTASAGTNWHDLVLDTVRQGLIGLENLSLIPGLVGAAPVQNIGAYGVELCERFVSLRALHIASGQWQEFDHSDCEFSYRDSVFKHKDGQYLIASVTMELGEHWGLQTSYKALSDYLDQHYTGQTVDSAMVSQAVCSIRQSKLPDPQLLPNAGSFFHNPVVSAEKFQSLIKRFPSMVGYQQPEGNYKLAAGWLIEYLGFKGHRENGVGVHDKQALVLVNYDQANCNALLVLADAIQQRVLDEFEVNLTIEPRMI